MNQELQATRTINQYTSDLDGKYYITLTVDSATPGLIGFSLKCLDGSGDQMTLMLREYELVDLMDVFDLAIAEVQQLT